MTKSYESAKIKLMKKIKIHEKTFSEILKELKNIYLVAKKYAWSIALFTVFSLFGTVFGILTSLISQSIIDFVTSGSTADSIIKFNNIYVLAVSAVIFALFRILFNAFNSRISEKISLKINTEMTAEIFDEFICSEWRYSSLYSTGDILQRFNSDVSVVTGSVLGIAPSFISKAFQFVASFVIILYYDPVMALIALVSVPLTLIFSRFLMKRMHTYAREVRKIGSRLTTFNQDALNGIQYLKSFGLVNIFCVKLRKIQREYIKLDLDYNKFSIIVTSVMSFMTQIITYACFGWGVYRLWTGKIGVGTLVLFIELYSALSSSFSGIAGIVPTVINAVAASERLTEIRNLPKDDIGEFHNELNFYNNSKGKKLELNLKNVSFKYSGEKQNALENISFKAATGDFIALTGPSGEGKTTMLRIFLSLVTPDEGEAFIKCLETGEKIALSPGTRRFFSYVPQNNTMFSDTLADNMRLVNETATDDDIINALKTACAYDFVMEEKDGIYCKVGNGGVGFSEGQMQRLSIARALLRDAPIMLFDEATSALDPATEKEILNNLAMRSEDKIFIFTTHRLSVLDVCTKEYNLKA